MRHPPEPHYSFTIPSIHDDATLDGRVYHPDALNETRSTDTGGETKWSKRGIVMAHPYAPMGGSYDDRIVGIVVDEFLKADWVVGTFNFRGAHGSKGHTSWSGRPELDDYISFAAFFMHYMCYLQPSPAADAVFTPEQSPVSPSQLQSPVSSQHNDESPVVVLGGYSYGSLILKHLPPVPTILQPFAAPLEGSAANEILLRARKLAGQSNLEWINRARSLERERKDVKQGYENKLSVTMGGEETSPDKRRSSREVRRSLDGHRNLNIGNRLRSLSHRTPKDDVPRTPPPESKSVAITMPNIRYLLISPLTPPISTLAAPALASRFWGRSKDSTQELFGKYMSLAIFGDQDIFASAKKTREWAEHFKAIVGSQFTSVEVEGAGHFWVEMGVEERLRSALRDWEAEIQN